MDTVLRHSTQGQIALPTWKRLIPIIRAAFVCGVLALALVSIMFLGIGASNVPVWIQGIFALGGITAGAFLGALRGTAA